MSFKLITSLFEESETRGVDASGYWGVDKSGLIVYHKDALVSSRWMGLHNSNERESLLSLLVYGDQNAYNDTKICFWKPSGEIQLGIEQDLLENCKNKLGEGKGWNDVIYAQTPPPPLNHPGIITWQWKPWTSDEKDLFRRWIIEKLTAMKPIYLGALKKLETISPLEVAKASVNPVETTWKQSQVRYFMAVLIQNKIFNSLIKLEENWIVSSETNLRGYARLKKLAGQVELCIDFVFDAKSITYSIGLIAGGNQQAFSKAISQILLQNPQERINLTPVNGFLSETVQFEGKAFNERGLTLSAWLNEVESILMERLPKLLTLHKTVEVHLLEAVKLTDILTKKLSSIFPYPEWILVNEAGTLLPDKNISVFKKTWAVDSEAKIPLLQFSFEQEGFALESLFAGITGSGFPKLSQSLKETVKAVFTAEFSSDHKPEFNEWWNWVYVKDEFRHPSFIDGKNSISEKEAEFVEYVNSLFLRLKKLSPVIDVCVKEVKNAKG